MSIAIGSKLFPVGLVLVVGVYNSIEGECKASKPEKREQLYLRTSHLSNCQYKYLSAKPAYVENSEHGLDMLPINLESHANIKACPFEAQRYIAST